MSAHFASNGPAAAAAAGEAPTVRVSTETDRAAWDRFVQDAPGGTFFHLSGWRRVIEDVCGHRTHYLYATRGSQITGVLPLAEVKSRLFGHSLISTPFCVYGGAVAASEADRGALEQYARSLAERLRVDYLELRNLQKSAGQWGGKDLYVTFRKRITNNDDENLKAIPRKQRAMVRKGIDAQLQSTVGADVDNFYAMYSESVRNLGTPVLAKKFFAALLREFGSNADVLTVTHDGTPVSSVMSFYFRDEVLPYYGGGTSAARDLKANDFMYWALMQHSVKRGATLFDFGRSKTGTGSFSFKKNWGFEPQNLEYQYHLVRSASVPNLSPTNPKYRALIATWKRLPVWVTQAVGPMIAKHLG
jgi:FemAB-related protein (PEP-CTERM system-associated)